MAAELLLWSTRCRRSALGVTLISTHMNHSELIRVQINTSVASVHFLRVDVVKMAKIFKGGKYVFMSQRGIEADLCSVFLCEDGRKIVLEGVGVCGCF